MVKEPSLINSPGYIKDLILQQKTVKILIFSKSLVNSLLPLRIVLFIQLPRINEIHEIVCLTV